MKSSNFVKFLLVGSFIGFLSFQALCQEEISGENFEINTLQLEIQFDEKGMITVIHTAEITIEPGEEVIRYDLWSEHDFNIKSITFNKESKEWLDMELKGYDTYSLPILIGMDHSRRSGTLEIVYETNSHYPFLPIENTEDLILISKVYLQNFGKFSKKLQKDSIDIIISAPESFPRVWNVVNCNFRFVNDKTGTIKKISYYFILEEQKLDGIKKYISEFSVSDREIVPSNDFSFLDLELIPICSAFARNYIFGYYRIETDASNLDNIEGEIEVFGRSLHSQPKISIKYIPFKDPELDESSQYDYNIEKGEKDRGKVIVSFPETEENLTTRNFSFTIKSGFKYEDFAKYQNPFYDVFSWKENFSSRNPDSFIFKLIIPYDSIVLEIKPENYYLKKKRSLEEKGTHIEWDENALPEDKHESEEFFVKYIPRKKYLVAYYSLLAVTLYFLVVWWLNRIYYHFNNYFLSFLVGWSLWNLFIWISIPVFPECFDILAFSQIPIILLYSYSFGHKTPRILRIFLALLIIFLWFLPDFSKAAPIAIEYLGDLLDVKDIGSKILLGILIFLVGKYGRQTMGQFLETSRRNAIYMGILAPIVIFAIYLYARAGVRNDIFFEGKMILTLLLGTFLLISSIMDKISFKDEPYTFGGIFKVKSIIFTKERICYCRGQISDVFLIPENLKSEEIMRKEFVWIKFSNSNGFPAFGLEYDKIRINSEISVLGTWLTEEEISEDDRKKVRDLEDLIDAVYIYETHSRNLKNDLMLQWGKAKGILKKIKEKFWK